MMTQKEPNIQVQCQRPSRVILVKTGPRRNHILIPFLKRKITTSAETQTMILQLGVTPPIRKKDSIFVKFLSAVSIFVKLLFYSNHLMYSFPSEVLF